MEVVLAVVTILWLPVIELLSDQVFVYIQSVSMYLAPPIVCVYFLGVLWWRANAHGATAAFIVGYTLGVARLVGEIVAKVSPPPAGSVAAVLVETNYLYAGLVLFGCSARTDFLSGFLFSVEPGVSGTKVRPELFTSSGVLLLLL